MPRSAPISVHPLEDRLTPATPLPAGDGLFVSGSGPGGPPLVQVFNPTGELRSQFLAYDERFTGGVSVTIADVNKDGTPDVITAAMAGGGPHVKVFDGITVRNLPHPDTVTLVAVPPPALLHTFFAYDVRFTGGVSVAGADVDGDGFADVITGAGAGGGPHVKVFSGKTGAEVRSFMAFDPAFRGGVNVTAGELQHDPFIDATAREFADIIVGSGAGMKATVTGFNGRTGDAFFTINPYGDFTGGAYVASGDLTGDGFDDVITGAGAGGGPHVTAHDGFFLGNMATILVVPGYSPQFQSFMAYDAGFRGGVRVAVGDVGERVQNDILTAAGPGGGPHLKAFQGKTAAELVSTFKPRIAPSSPAYSAGATIGGVPNSIRPTHLPLPGPHTSFSRLSDFSRGTENWTAGFSDFTTLSQPDQMKLDSGVTKLPSDIGAGTGYQLEGNNTSSDLFMYLKRKFGMGDGLTPNTTYTLDFAVSLASDAPAGLAGGGGAPAESVHLKVGGGATEPNTVTPQPNEVRLNVDKGNQSTGGTYATVIGDIANGRGPTEPRQYASVTRTGRHTARSDAAGNLWLLVGTDSGYQGFTSLFYQSIEVTFTPTS